MLKLIRRECRVAFSKKAQPTWLRVSKWLVVLTSVALFWRYPLYWWIMVGWFALALGVHFFYRWKTHGWRRAWGGWSDLEAGR